MKPNSFIIKVCLMKHYRFKRGFICVDELGYEPADVLVDTGEKIIEIEIKISKHDLIKGEAKKRKHKKADFSRGCQQFYVCVPSELVKDAEQWIKDTNDKYGLIEFRSDLLYMQGYKNWQNYLLFLKRAKTLNNNYRQDLDGRLSKRLCSALINSYERRIK